MRRTRNTREMRLGAGKWFGRRRRRKTNAFCERHVPKWTRQHSPKAAESSETDRKTNKKEEPTHGAHATDGRRDTRCTEYHRILCCRDVEFRVCFMVHVRDDIRNINITRISKSLWHWWRLMCVLRALNMPHITHSNRGKTSQHPFQGPMRDGQPTRTHTRLCLWRVEATANWYKCNARRFP